jgi:hypothetical protein
LVRLVARGCEHLVCASSRTADDRICGLVDRGMPSFESAVRFLAFDAQALVRLLTLGV